MDLEGVLQEILGSRVVWQRHPTTISEVVGATEEEKRTTQAIEFTWVPIIQKIQAIAAHNLRVE